MTKSFCQLVVDAAESNLEKNAMRIVGEDGSEYNYAEMLRSIRSIAFRLEEEGVAFGDRVAVIGENHPSWAIAYLGTLYRGAVCVPLDPHGEIETITNFLENSEAKAAFLSPEMTGKFQEIEVKLGRHIPAVVWNLETSPNGFQRFEDWATTEVPLDFGQNDPSAADTDTALLIYTSGTTGTPKGVPLTHGNILAELHGVDDVLKFREGEKILSLLPLFHAYLQIVNLWVATTKACEVGYLKELSPAALGEAMKEFKPTILTTVPRLWYLFHKKIFDAVEAKPKPVQMLFKTMLAANGFARDTLGVNLGARLFGQVHESFGGNLRIAISAGSRFDEDVATDFHRLGFTIIQGYGLTETSGAATATYETDNRVGSVGKPMGDAEIKIDNPDKEGVGEVLIKGGMVFDGYYRNPEANAEAFTGDGWFRSGDLGRLDKDGHLYIVGRAKDVIVLPSGKNVHPEDLEVHYLKTPLIEELAIIGINDDSEKRSGAEKLAAVVVPDFEYLKLSKIANSKEAIRYALDDLGRELPEYQRVRDYIIRAEPLPRTATRKIKRFELKKEIENGTIGGTKGEAKTWQLSTDDDLLLGSNTAKAVVSAIRQNARDAEIIHPEMNLEIDLGLDSLGRAETFAALEHAFSTEFNAEEAARSLTVRDVVELVESHREPGAPDSEPVSTDLNWATILKETDSIPEVQTVLRNRPVFLGFVFVVYKLFNFFCRIFMRLEVSGLENLQKMKRPFLICPNHQSFLDPFVICSNYPFEFFRHTFHVGASEFFVNRFMKFAAKMLNVVPVDPDTQLMRAMKAGAIGLKNGKILNIYPEGQRAYDGELHEFKKGAAILATELELPILPVAIDGLQNVWARRTWRIRPAKVKIRFGEAFYARDIAPSTQPDTPDLSAQRAITAGPPDFGGNATAMKRVSSVPSGEQKYHAVTDHLKLTIAEMIGHMRNHAPKR